MRGVILCILLGALLCSAFEGKNNNWFHIIYINICLSGNLQASNVGHVRSTSHWAIEVVSDINPDELAAEHGFVNLGPVGTLKNVYLFHKDTQKRVNIVEEDDEDLPSIHDSPHVAWAENLVARKRFLRFGPPSDPLFNNQWHLVNRAGVDINVLPAWENGIGGSGITIALVDDGLQRTHPDISHNYVAEASYDFNENDPYPDPHGPDDHGTSAGGVAAARNNNGVCGSGAAPDARLSGN